jgi:hypothetical protein
MAIVPRRVLFSINAAAAAAVLLLSSGCHKNAALPVQGPEPFTAQLPEVEGVQAILSLRHPALVNQDLEKLMVNVPEAGIMRMALSQAAAYGYPDFPDIAAGSNIGVAILSLSGADLKAKSVVYVGFAKLKKGGGLWSLLNMAHLAAQETGEWVMFAKDQASLAKLKSPEAVMAYLDKPQADDIRLWGRVSPDLLAGLREALMPGLDARISSLTEDQQKAAHGYIDALYSWLLQLHSVDFSMGFDDFGFKIAESAQFLPETPIGTFLRFREGPPPEVAGFISADALGTMIFRQNPKAASDLTGGILDSLIAVDYPNGSGPLKELKAGIGPMMAASSGGGAATFDLAVGKRNGREQVTPEFFYVISGRFTREIVRAYARSSLDMSKGFSSFIAGKLASAPGAGALFPSFPYTYAEDSLSVDGVSFDCWTLPVVANGKEISRTTEYFGAVDGNFIMASSEAALRKHLPALTARTALADGIRVAEGPGEIARMSLNGGKLVDVFAEAAGLDLGDAGTKGDLAGLTADYAAGEPASAVMTVGQARGSVTLAIPYKFIEASVHFGRFMGAKKVNLFSLMTGAGMPSAGSAQAAQTDSGTGHGP